MIYLVTNGSDYEREIYCACESRDLAEVYALVVDGSIEEVPIQTETPTRSLVCFAVVSEGGKVKSEGAKIIWSHDRVTEPVEGHGGWYIEAESIDEMARMINEVAR